MPFCHFPQCPKAACRILSPISNSLPRLNPITKNILPNFFLRAPENTTFFVTIQPFAVKQFLKSVKNYSYVLFTGCRWHSKSKAPLALSGVQAEESTIILVTTAILKMHTKQFNFDSFLITASQLTAILTNFPVSQALYFTPESNNSRKFKPWFA